MDLGEVLLADVAVLRSDRPPELGLRLGVGQLWLARREVVGGGEDRLPTELADPGLVQLGLVDAGLLRLPEADRRLDQLATGNGVGVIGVLDRREEALVIVPVQGREEAAVGNEPFEELGGGLELRDERRVGRTGLGGEGSG